MMLTSTTNSMPGDWEMEWLWAFRLSIQKPDSTFPDVEATGIVLGRRTAPGGALWSLPATTMASNRCGSDILTVPSGTWKTKFTSCQSKCTWEIHLEEYNTMFITNNIRVKKTILTRTVVNVSVNSCAPKSETPSCPSHSTSTERSRALICSKRYWANN